VQVGEKPKTIAGVIQREKTKKGRIQVKCRQSYGKEIDEKNFIGRGVERWGLEQGVIAMRTRK